MITFSQRGDFKKLSSFLERAKEVFNIGILDKYGELGVNALAAMTPKETGTTANSWDYRIVRGKGYCKLQFINTNVQNGVPIAIVLQYGHATKSGGFVEGRDYINPAVRPVFEQLANEAWREATKA